MFKPEIETQSAVADTIAASFNSILPGMEKYNLEIHLYSPGKVCSTKFELIALILQLQVW